jgi:outer membrane protein assembly factor BamB
VLWERAAPQVKTKVVDKRNNPASPSPAVEENGVYVFFPDFGLIAYDASGAERWSMPLGPFTNIYGMGASPVIVGDLVVLACDQSVGSFIMAVDKRSGRVAWRRAAVTRPRSSGADPTARIRSSSPGRSCSPRTTRRPGENSGGWAASRSR